MGVAYKKSRGCNWVACIILIALVAAAIVVAVVVIKNKNKSSGGGDNTPSNFAANYTQAMTTALTFLDIQKSGKLPANFPISWRGDSNLDDGSDVGVDLSGGLYDAGDSIKFGFPMAFTATILSWSVLEYGPAMESAGRLTSAKASLKWITDYLIKAHPAADELYFQVGDPALDHKCWLRPEDGNLSRPSLKLNATVPGSEVAAETAAAMAAASIVFKGDNATYAATLVSHAEQLFNFSNTYRQSYIVSVPDVQAYYNSTGFGDELLWGATWLYYATGNNDYLAFVTGVDGQNFAQWGVFPSWFSWDRKLPAVQVLLARLQMLNPPANAQNAVSTGLKDYKSTADGLMCAFLPNSPSATPDRTKGGLLWIQEWSSLQQGINSGLLASFYSDYLSAAKQSLTCGGKSFTAAQLKTFAASQANYVLGNNPLSQSYMVGYGTKYPKYLHHRGASIPMSSIVTDCGKSWSWYESTSANPNIAYGAIVGGPAKNETYKDERTNIQQNEASVYNSASFFGLSAGLSVSGSNTISKAWL